MDLLVANFAANQRYVFHVHINSVSLPTFETPKVSSRSQKCVDKEQANCFPMDWFTGGCFLPFTVKLKSKDYAVTSAILIGSSYSTSNL